MADSRLQVVEDDPFPTNQHPVNKLSIETIGLALQTLSQKTIVALASLFTLITVGSAFVLWFVTPDPTPYQLVKLAMYGVFVLGANWIVRRR